MQKTRRKIVNIILATFLLLGNLSSTILAEEVEVNNFITGSYTFINEGQVTASPDEFKFSEDCFKRSSHLGGCHLATLSMQAAGASLSTSQGTDVEHVPNYGAVIKDLLQKIGFKDIELNSYYTKEDKQDSAGVSVGRMSINEFGEEYTLLAIIPRSAGYTNEWPGNFNVGENKLHEGYKIGRDEILRFVKKYINDKNVKGNVKVWIAGHSRGAALANSVAGFFAAGGDVYFGNITVKPEDVYAYTFATPLTVIDGFTKGQLLSVGGPKYPDDTVQAEYQYAGDDKDTTLNSYDEMFNGIRNYVSDYDFFDLLPLKSWGYKHFGIDLIVDEIGSKDEMLNYLSQHATDTYQDFIDGGDFYEYKWKTIDIGNTDIPNSKIEIINDESVDQIDYATMLSRRLDGLAYKVPDVATFKNYGYQDAVISFMNIYAMARNEFSEGVSKAKYEDLIKTLIYTYLDYRIDLSGSDNNADTVTQVVEETVSFITGATFNHETNTFDNTVYQFLKYIDNHAVVTEDDVHYNLPLIEHLINGNVISTLYPDEYTDEEKKAQRFNFYNNYLKPVASETGSIARSVLYGFVADKLPSEYKEIFVEMLNRPERDMPLVEFVDEILKIVLKDSESSEQLSFEQLSVDGIKNLIQLGINEISNSDNSHKDELINHGNNLKNKASQFRDFLIYTLIYDNKLPSVEDDIRNIVTFISQISKLVTAHVNEIYLSWMKVQQEDCTAYFDHRVMREAGEDAECEKEGIKEYYHLIDLNVDRYFLDSKLTEEINKEDTVIEALGHDFGEWQIIKEATETEEGLKRKVCKNNSEHVEEEVIPALGPLYVDKKGDGNSWYKGSKDNSEFVFIRTRNDELTYSMFDGIKVDGSGVNTSNYKYSKGSVVIELYPKYLETLSVGQHKLTAIFKDGNDVTVSFNILEKSNNNTPRHIVPNTGAK